MADSRNAGRGIAAFISGFGWVAILSGLAIALVGLGFMLNTGDFSPNGLLPIAVGCMVAVLGLLVVANAQLVRAAKVNSAFTRELVELLKGEVKTLAGIAAEAAEPNAARADGDRETVIPPDILKQREPAARAAVATTTAAAAPLADDSDPRTWPHAIDEFDHDGRLAMTLEDGSVAIELPEGWRRFRSLADAGRYLAKAS